MKKFSKILTLILALVAILTAFTVVALAEDAAEPGYVQPFATTTFDGYTVGASWETPQGAGTGGALTVQEAYPDGNKYLYINGSTSSTATLNYSYMGGGDSTNRQNYNMSKYPIVAFDFDLMTPDGDWGLYSTSKQNDGNSAGLYFRPYYKGQDISNGWFKQISFGALGLPTTAYKWHHVTVVFVYSEENVEITNEETDEVTTEKHGFVTQTTYVNGQALTNSLASWVSGAKVDITAKGGTVGDMFFGPVYIKSARYDGTNSEQIIDNMQYTYFKAGYDVSKIPTLIYNDTWVSPYTKTVATVTTGEGEEAVVNYFDNIDKACEFANANPGSVAVRVNSDGTTTPFSQIYPSVKVGDAVKYFADLGDAAEFAAATPGSKLTLIADVTANYTVDSAFSIDANIYDAEGNITGTYAGIDTYARTTVGYYMKETAEGSGIYEATKGDFMVSQSDGSYIAYPASEFDAKFTALAGSATLKLLSDIETSAIITISGSARTFTLDLNGHELRRVCYYGDVYEATGDEVEYTQGTATTSTGSVLFNTPASGGKKATLTITSTAGTNGKIYNIVAKATTYIRDGKVERREIHSYSPTTMVSTQTTGSAYYFSNVDIYSTNFASTTYNDRVVTYDLENVNFYQITPPAASTIQGNGTFVFYFNGRAGMTVNADNCLFYLHAGIPTDYATKGTVGLIRFSAATTAGNEAAMDVRFTNCDIIGAEGKWTVGNMSSKTPEEVVFDNCRFYNCEVDTEVVSTNGSIGNAFPVAASGWTKKPLAKPITISYDVPAIDGWVATTDAIQSVDFGFDTKQQVCTFTNITTKAIDVDLVDGDSTKTIQLFPGVDSIDDIRVVHELSDNDYLNVLCQWSDAAEGGNAVSGVLGLGDNEVVFDWETAKVTLYAQDTIGGVTKYVGGIKVANFNIGYMSGLRYNLYLPVEAPISGVSVDGFELGESSVSINGVKYNVYSKIVGTVAAGEGAPIKVTFTYDGAEYVQEWNLDVLTYAMLADAQGFDTNDTENTEKKAIGNMLKFVREVMELDSESEEAVTKFDEMITYLGVSTDFTTGNYSGGDANALSGISEAISNVSYVIYNGVASYKFYLNGNYELTFTTSAGDSIVAQTLGDAESGYYVLLEPMRVYDLTEDINIAYGGATATFGLLDYLAGQDAEVVKALYDFANAAKAYKDYLTK